MREIYQWIINCFVLTMVVLMIVLSLPDGGILTGMYLVYAGWAIGLIFLFICIGAKSQRVKLVFRRNRRNTCAILLSRFFILPIFTGITTRNTLIQLSQNNWSQSNF